jgi:hypothetical protein
MSQGSDSRDAMLGGLGRYLRELLEAARGQAGLVQAGGAKPVVLLIGLLSEYRRA